MEFYIIENMIKLNDKEMEFQILLFLIVIFFFDNLIIYEF